MRDFNYDIESIIARDFTPAFQILARLSNEAKLCYLTDGVVNKIPYIAPLNILKCHRVNEFLLHYNDSRGVLEVYTLDKWGIPKYKHDLVGIAAKFDFKIYSTSCRFASYSDGKIKTHYWAFTNSTASETGEITVSPVSRIQYNADYVVYTEIGSKNIVRTNDFDGTAETVDVGFTITRLFLDSDYLYALGNAAAKSYEYWDLTTELGSISGLEITHAYLEGFLHIFDTAANTIKSYTTDLIWESSIAYTGYLAGMKMVNNKLLLWTNDQKIQEIILDGGAVDSIGDEYSMGEEVTGLIDVGV